MVSLNTGLETILGRFICTFYFCYFLLTLCTIHSTSIYRDTIFILNLYNTILGIIAFHSREKAFTLVGANMCGGRKQQEKGTRKG
jgi:hypothetical protein